LITALLSLPLLSLLIAQAGALETSCTACHANPEFFTEEEQLSIPESWQASVHADVGISCHDCHGGNSSMELADDMAGAMDPAFSTNPFRDVPAFQEIPEFCGRCHSDPAYMKRFRPDTRVDQVEEYWTSGHGKALKEGNEKVANCTRCHGSHGILRADNPRSSVYPTQVAVTCGKCHADPEWMSGILDRHGEPYPVDQVAEWRQSVHARGLIVKGDLTSPTCNDCHGNHGAAPPGLESVTFVCGQCHGREAELFRQSPKHAGFVRHNEYLVATGGEGCSACHVEPEPASRLSGVKTLGECTACHGNHAVMRPVTAMLSVIPKTPCEFCHGQIEAGPDIVHEPEKVREHFHRVLGDLIAEGGARGLEGVALYDWLVDRAQELPFHTGRVTEDGEEKIALRVEFGKLFAKFRIGKVSSTYVDSASGKEVTRRARLCSDCHDAAPEAPQKSKGMEVARSYMELTQKLQALTARAERIFFLAERGGVEVSEAREALDRSVDTQISLQVLAHTFAIGEGSPFYAAYQEGLAHTTLALEASQKAAEELGTRRKGLAISLVFILLVLVALGLAIRRRSPRS
jgi:hypothetical protein